MRRTQRPERAHVGGRPAAKARLARAADFEALAEDFEDFEDTWRARIARSEDLSSRHA
ncbi:hypothetical protein [Streptomyces sp. NRRL S-378]|uniref:hypothetical protein n=1 Tax=Streptomyces sp. NRRL S-378 TaxID=1463904 RepID=UPI000B14F5FD|nr:hypothetical protein [Streptomyces sp. NRRL S-378]